MKEWLLVLKAADAAARWHVHRRKGPAEEPYINHLIEIAMLVADATDGSDTNLVIAALLHDAIEDFEVPRELIAETFGEDVASLVAETSAVAGHLTCARVCERNREKVIRPRARERG